MIDLTKYNELKAKADKAKADADRAEGALEQQMAGLKKEFDCSTVEEAEKLLASLRQDEQDMEAVCNERMAAFETQWGDLL